MKNKLEDIYDEGFKHGTEWGTIHEQERIIKLLERNETLFRQYVAYEALIALIKGGQK